MLYLSPTRGSLVASPKILQVDGQVTTSENRFKQRSKPDASIGIRLWVDWCEVRYHLPGILRRETVYW